MTSRRVDDIGSLFIIFVAFREPPQQLRPHSKDPRSPILTLRRRNSTAPALLKDINMQRITIVAVAAMLLTAPALAQSAGPSVTPAPAKPAAAAAAPTHVSPPKPVAAASTPEQRSAAALALSGEPTYDEGTAQRLKDAALSYSDIAVRGGWPTIPTDAQFALGVAGPNDDLLRLRLISSEDLAADKT